MRKIELIKDFKPRIYQQSIFANALNKNTLVILPTGLGKTIVALMLTIYYFNQSQKKVLFLAPTKPLVEQQEKSFKTFFKNAQDFNFKVLTGQIQPQKRIDAYKENDFIFSTPQLIENDIINRIINPKDFGLVIFDEAHRGVGNYAYTFIAEELSKANTNILALTASPGTSKDEIENVMQNLKIEHIEVKKYEDSDVKPYVKETKIQNIEVELDKNFKKISNLLNKVFEKKVEQLKALNYLQGKSTSQITKTDLLDLQAYIRHNISRNNTDKDTWKAISISAGLMKLQYGIELFESQEISSAHNYFYNFFRDGGDKTKAVEDLTIDINFRQAFDEISIMLKNNLKHPKLLKLKELISEELQKNKDLRIIVFNQYRDTAQKIVKELETIKEIKPTVFVGQAQKGETKMSQKEQKKVLDNFREGKFNVLVSTSVGEEGLDIPKVDLVIFYEPIPSAIRTIQRIGRTGRFKKGLAYILIAKNTRDVIVKYIANAKEKKMYKVLDEIKKKYNNPLEDKNKNLIQFMQNKQNQKKKIQKNIKTIIFDYGNVLGGHGFKNIIHKYLKEKNISYDKWENETHKYWKFAEQGQMNSDAFFMASAQVFGFENWQDHKKEVMGNMLDYDKDMIELCKTLKTQGFKLAILSNNIKDIIPSFIEKANAKDLFDKIVVSCDVGIKKPQKEIYEHLLKELNSNPQECLFVDNKEKNLYPAQKLQIQTLLFSNYLSLTKDLENLNILTQTQQENTPYKIDGIDDRILIYIDNRENSDLIKECFKLDEIKIESKKLDVGDIVISENIAIERKAQKDFIDSILDKRLFHQLLELTKNYRRPLLIIEGGQDIFTIRNVNPNVIRSSLGAIAIDLRIPIIYTDSIQETAQMIQIIAKRTIKPKRDISLATNKTSFSENEELEKFISTIPKINVVTAKGLLYHFESIKKLANSTQKDLIKIEGIGPKKAQFLEEFFKRKYKKE